jgi:hypothetical protein
MGKWTYAKIPGIYKDLAEGHAVRGMIPITARIGKTSWSTSLLPVKKDGSFII